MLFALVCAFYGVIGVGSLVYLNSCRLPWQKAPPSPKHTVALAAITRSSGSPVGYV